MPFKSKRAKITLALRDKEKLERIVRSRTESKSRIERAQMILGYSAGESINSLSKRLGTNRPKIERTVDKAIAYGVLTALNDRPRKGATPKITKEAKRWFFSVACTKPKDLGLASEFWTYQALAAYIRDNCRQFGHPSLSKIRKGTIYKIVAKSNIQPYKQLRYSEKQNSDFSLMEYQVLYVHKEIELYKNNKKTEMIGILSHDEKPGTQSTENIASNLKLFTDEYVSHGIDYEFKKHGIFSLFISIDLLKGEIDARVKDSYSSIEFLEYLKRLDKIYPIGVKIKIVLDNHYCHTSQETEMFLKTVPNRFEFVFTPVNASWLGLIEVFFSEMTRSFLRGIRVKSKDELQIRILKYIDEVKQIPPVLYRSGN
ncbi:MAG: IS630 family transposase [Fulvivirga sp.]